MPTAIATPLRDAIATLRRANLGKPEAVRVAREASGDLVARAFFAAGFPEAKPISGPFTACPLLASELSAPQRLLVEVYADIDEALSAELEETPHLHGRKVPIPIGHLTLRRWIGKAPPSVLEEEHDLDGRRWPLWRHACDGDGASDVMRKLVDAVPLAQGIAMLDALSHWSGYGFDPVRNLHRDSRPVREMKDEGVPWARAQIAGWLASIAGGTRIYKGSPQPHFQHDSALFAMLAMARGGVAIEPEWDQFLVCSFEHSPATFVEAAMAIPEERRHIAAARAVRGWGQNDTKVDKALALLDVFDSADLARAVFELLPRTIRAKRTVQLLTEMSATRPGVARALAEHRGKLPRPIPLTVREKVQPIVATALSPMHAKQLAALRKSDPDNFADAEMVADLELRVLVDAEGEPAFDAWLYATDTGVYYATGTTKVVAHRVQGGMEAVGKTSPSVLAGLDAMSARRGAPSNMAVRPPVKKKKRVTPPARPRPGR